MILKHLSTEQKKNASLVRKLKRAEQKKIRQVEVISACFSFVAGSDGHISSKESKFIANAISSIKALKDFSKNQINFHITELSLIAIRGIISHAKFTPLTRQSFQRQLFVNLLELAECDGDINKEELDAIEYIASLLKFSTLKLDRIKARFDSKNRARKILERKKEKNVLDKYFAILNCLPTDSLSVIKKSYRKLAAIHHPDKHIFLKLSASELERHKKNFQKIQDAYEHILKNTKLL